MAESGSSHSDGYIGFRTWQVTSFEGDSNQLLIFAFLDSFRIHWLRLVHLRGNGSNDRFLFS